MQFARSFECYGHNVLTIAPFCLRTCCHCVDVYYSLRWCTQIPLSSASFLRPSPPFLPFSSFSNFSFIHLPSFLLCPPPPCPHLQYYTIICSASPIVSKHRISAAVHILHFPVFFSVFTALHVMQTRYCDENSVCLSVRLSVTRVYCDKTVERSVQIYIPYERTFSLVF